MASVLESAFDPTSVSSFALAGLDWDPSTRTARLGYALDEFRFEERWTFPGGRATDAATERALERALRHLHVAAGTSYYKAACPPTIDATSADLSPAGLRFFEDLYVHGLAEFGHRNGIDVAARVRFGGEARGGASGVGVGDASAVPSLPRRTAIPIGGGKDSIVALEMLRGSPEPLVGLAVGRAAPIVATAEHAGLPLLVIERRLDPRLAELNRAGALNGHVPVTAIFAFAFHVAAFTAGFDAIALALESSANEPSLGGAASGGGGAASPVSGTASRGRSDAPAAPLDRAVNHQWSKSLTFERALRRHLASELRSPVEVFSILRPFGELRIARRFAALEPYHDVFMSCNRNFRQDARGAPRWCGACPKCRFVFLALAPFVPRSRLVAIFGADLLDDAAALEDWAALAGLTACKPFECVGTRAEVRAAFTLLARRPEWAGCAALRFFEARAPGVLLDRDAVREALEGESEDAIPERFRERVDAWRRDH